MMFWRGGKDGGAASRGGEEGTVFGEDIGGGGMGGDMKEKMHCFGEEKKRKGKGNNDGKVS